jgi:hypothetical protein
MVSTTSTHLRDAPALTAAGLGLLSGIISAASFGLNFEPDWLKPIGNLFLLNAGAVPIGVCYGVAIGVAAATASKRLWAAPLLVITTMIAWSVAIHSATLIYNSDGEINRETVPTMEDGVRLAVVDGLRLFWASMAAGAVGACMTHLGVALLDRRLRRLPRFALTTLVGALCGVVFFLGEKNYVYPGALYIIWQPAVAFCIGLGMGRAAG